MKLNCKAGDLAIVVRVFSPINNWMLGRVVQCATVEMQRGLAGWRLDSPIVSPPSHVFDYEWLADRCLHPIRDEPGEDETLTWAGLPNKQGVPA